MNGGKIQYVKYPVSYNTQAVKTLVNRAMDLGFYEGVNLSLSCCDDCGHKKNWIWMFVQNAAVKTLQKLIV